MTGALEAVVFDFDGVIANSEPLHLRAFQEVIAGIGVQLSAADYYARYLGYDDVGAFEAMARDAGKALAGEAIKALVDQKAVRLQQLGEQGAVLFPGAADAIVRCATEVPVAVASGALGAEIEHVLSAAGLRGYFVTVVSAGDTRRSKPAPDPYLLALTRLRAHAGRNIDPRGVVALEDSVWGLESARAAGLRTVGIAQTYAASALTMAELVLASVGDVNPSRLRGALSLR